MLRRAPCFSGLRVLRHTTGTMKTSDPRRKRPVTDGNLGVIPVEVWSSILVSEDQASTCSGPMSEV